jgi:hypothetical protein
MEIGKYRSGVAGPVCVGGLGAYMADGVAPFAVAEGAGLDGVAGAGDQAGEDDMPWVEGKNLAWTGWPVPMVTWNSYPRAPREPWSLIASWGNSFCGVVSTACGGGVRAGRDFAGNKSCLRGLRA